MATKVLVIDDEAPIRLLCRVNLEAEGMEVLEAADGPSGLETARAETPDVILLDVMMPGLDGWRVAEELLDDERTEGIPIVFLTARAELRDRARGIDLGGVDYVTKPFNPVELAPLVRDLLDRVDRGERDELRREKLSELRARARARIAVRREGPPPDRPLALPTSYSAREVGRDDLRAPVAEERAAQVADADAHERRAEQVGPVLRAREPRGDDPAGACRVNRCPRRGSRPRRDPVTANWSIRLPNAPWLKTFDGDHLAAVCARRALQVRCRSAAAPSPCWARTRFISRRSDVSLLRRPGRGGRRQDEHERCAASADEQRPAIHRVKLQRYRLKTSPKWGICGRISCKLALSGGLRQHDRGQHDGGADELHAAEPLGEPDPGDERARDRLEHRDDPDPRRRAGGAGR